MPKKEKSIHLLLSDIRQILREKKDHEEGFSKLMEEQPNLALEKCLGEKFPKNIKVHFVEDTLDKLYVVLPANPEELTDEQLKFVSGGAPKEKLIGFDTKTGTSIYEGPPGYEIHIQERSDGTIRRNVFWKGNK